LDKRPIVYFIEFRTFSGIMTTSVCNSTGLKVLFFHTSHFSGELIQRSEESHEHRFFDCNNLPHLNIHQARFIQDWVNNQVTRNGVDLQIPLRSLVAFSSPYSSRLV